MVDHRHHGKAAHILVYSDRADHNYAMKVRLRQEGFRLTTSPTLDSFILLYKQQTPDILIIRSFALPRDVVKILKRLSSQGINFGHSPTFLLVRGCVAHFLIPLLEIGLQDIVDVDEGIDALVPKLKEVRSRLILNAPLDSEVPRPQSGSRGNLSDMSIIDLIQALGPSQRTARITVRPDAGNGALIIYLNRGNIAFAQYGELLAEQAIYKALAWERGTWLLEPVTETDLPPANNSLPNELILMEGCRLIDESSREAQAADSSSTQ